MNYYIAGVPFSDELYHHGTKGQKWGRRLYQNEDGSLTPLGRIHYGVGNAIKTTGEVLGKSGKAMADYVVKKYKKSHPESMTKEELNKEIERQKMLAELQRLKSQKKGETFAGKIVDNFAKASYDFMGSTAKEYGKKFASNLLKSSDERNKEDLDKQVELLKANSAYNRALFESRQERDKLNREIREYDESRSRNRRNRRNGSSSGTEESAS